jgi:hypothetical protein
MPLFYLIVAAGAFYWLWGEYSASKYLDGKEYYEACWELKAKRVGFEWPKPSSPYEAGKWKNCEPIARKAIFNNGLVFAGNEMTFGVHDERLRKVCPDLYAEVPSGGLFYLFVRDTEAQGGLSGIDPFLPATWVVGRWATKRWPMCAAERARLGYTEIVERSDGTFDFENSASSEVK